MKKEKPVTKPKPKTPPVPNERRKKPRDRTRYSHRMMRTRDE